MFHDGGEPRVWIQSSKSMLSHYPAPRKSRRPCFPADGGQISGCRICSAVCAGARGMIANPRSSGDAAGQSVTSGVGLLLLFVDTLDRQNFSKLCPGAIDAALDGSDRAIADLSGLLVGKA